MDWTDPTASEPIEKREDNMPSLTTGFTTQMRKRVASSQGETTPCSKVPTCKCPKRFGPNGKVQNNPAVITMDSPEWASDTVPALEGGA